ncbi:hypothetical protein [Pseudomonas sp. microsymbiont 2]
MSRRSHDMSPMPSADASSGAAGFRAPVERSVVHVRHLHAHHLDLKLFSMDVLLSVLPYEGMILGDTVKVCFQGITNDGEPLLASLELTAEVEHLDSPLTFELERERIEGLIGFSARFHYIVSALDDQEPLRKSQPVTIRIIDNDPLPRLLPQPAFDGLEGPRIYPVEHEQGVTLLLPATGRQPGDEILLYIDQVGTGGTNTLLEQRWLRVEQAQAGQANLSVAFAHGWLSSHVGKQLSMTWQLINPSESSMSASRSVELVAARTLSAPVVKDAVRNNDRFVIKAMDLRKGLTIAVPADTDTSDGTVTMHLHELGVDSSGYDGRPGETPSFWFAPEKVGGLLQNHVQVFYRFTTRAGTPQRSDFVWLEGEPFDVKHFPYIQCDLASGRPSLSLASVPSEGAPWHLEGWPLMGVGQTVIIKVLGGDQSGQDKEFVLRDTPVDEAELTAQCLQGVFPRSELEQLKLSEKFTLQVEVCFNGLRAYPLRPVHILLVA